MVTQLEEAVAAVRARCELRPRFGLVLGSGLGFLADEVENATAIDYGEIPNFPRSTVEGHRGRLVLGNLSGRPVAVMQGRFHFYEGYSLDKVVMGVRLFRKLGADYLLITNAAGGINPAFRPGDLMLITDHINLMGSNPLIGPNVDSLGPRFPDMSDAYCSELRDQALRIAKELGIELKQGVYAAMTGPSYETPAEIRMLAAAGADAVGMSTIPEVIAAVHAGMKVLGISCISNLAAGRSSEPLSHEEVKETAEAAREKFTRLVLALLERLE
ncbi:MAG: purine-nucleoside phosphorylase [Deltaproteobacteria bacterium]|nr:MAG: purine-nucleoside phosphorylase [Deltaproteobacteria bacterium]